MMNTGAAPTATLNSLSAGITATGFQDGVGLPLFIDGSGDKLYTGEVDGFPQRLGFAARIQLNPDVIDDPALLHAFARDCFYIGALGSRKTHAKRAERLKAQGASDADIARIHAPIGLSIGAVSPSEIAVAIMAEITAELRLPKETAKVQAA